jgi:hypothetical protein
MKADGQDSLPLVGTTARYLAVRRDVDIPVSKDDTVEPETGGMSVSPPPITNLHPLRLPRELGGLGKDSVFELETDELPDELTYRPDPNNPEGHGFIEPSHQMVFEYYERAIHATRGLWRPVR